MALENLASSALALAGTFLVHSTLLCGTAWLIARWITPRRPAAAERALKAAILGSLVSTACLHSGLIEPLLGRLPLAAIESAGEAARTEPFFAVPEHGFLPTPADGHLQPHSIPLTELEPELAARTLDSHASNPSWPWVLVACWAIGALVGLLRFALDGWRLARALSTRVALDRGELFERLETLRLGAGVQRRVRLSLAPDISVPLSFGWLRPEICLPPRARDELTPSESEAVLAHELAHLVRGDFAWLLFARTLESLLFFQPFLRLARRGLEDAAEFLCDEWAARRVGRGVELASSLARIAGWITQHERSLPAPAMARVRSRLSLRVERLLFVPATASLERSRWVTLTAPLWIAGVALSAPGFGVFGPQVQEPTPIPTEPVFEVPRAELDAPSEVAAPSAHSIDDPSEVGLLRAALFALEGEIAALEAEVREFESGLDESDAAPLFRLALARLHVRLESLAERRARIRELFDRLSPAFDAGGTAPSPSDPSEEQ